MTEAKRITKTWTAGTYAQEQFDLCVRKCVSRRDGATAFQCFTVLTFKDDSSIIFWEDGRWEVQV